MARVIAIIAIVCSVFIILCSSAKTKQGIHFQRVDNFEEYKAKHNLTLLREIRPPRKHHGSNRIMVSEDFQYTYEDGFRLAGDRLLARGLDGNQYQSPQDVTFIIQFPDPPSDPNFGSIIDYYQIVLTQSNNQFELYLEYGGAGYRRIKVVINIAPIPDHPFYMLIETSGSNGIHDEEKLDNFLLKCFESGNVLDGTIASEPSKIQKIWDIRELIPIALLKDGYTFAYDVSIPLRNFYDIVKVMRERVGDLATYVCGYGHLGDSNLHVDVACREFSQELYKRVEPFIFEYTGSLKGSISAEHGIGFLKSQYLRLSKSPEAIEMMKDLKTLLDPKGILNPYKILRD